MISYHYKNREVCLSSLTVFVSLSVSRALRVFALMMGRILIGAHTVELDVIYVQQED